MHITVARNLLILLRCVLFIGSVNNFPTGNLISKFYRVGVLVEGKGGG